MSLNLIKIVKNQPIFLVEIEVKEKTLQLHKLCPLSSHNAEGKHSLLENGLLHLLFPTRQLLCFKCSARQYVQANSRRLYNLILFHPKLRLYFQDTPERTRVS